MRLESYRALLALAASQDWEIHQIDVVGAYLNGELEETIFMKQPPGYEDGTPRACRLQLGLREKLDAFFVVCLFLIARSRKPPVARCAAEPFCHEKRRPDRDGQTDSDEERATEWEGR